MYATCCKHPARRRGLFALLCFLPALSSAQVSTGSIFGTVTDPTGAPIPGVTVTVVQAQTGLEHTVTSGPDGSYRVEFLPIGNYSIKADATTRGFSRLARSGITIDAMQTAHVDLALALSSATQEVVVTEAVPLINSSDSTLGRVIDNVEVDNLPLVNRNAYQLLSLTPGVQTTTNVNNLGFPEQHTFINGSTDGTVGQISYYLDGGLNMTGLRNTGNILPNPDAIQETTVETSNFSALYGRTSAGIVSVITKSGTNTLHGSIFDFERSNDLNASNSGSGAPAGPLHRHQFGATIGGPVRRNKTFFFGTYAGLRQVSTNFLTGALVPDALQRSGDFSENLPTASGPIISCTQALKGSDITDKSHGGHFVVCNPVTREPYAGNIITDPLDTAAVNVMSGNVPLPTNATTSQWIGPFAPVSNSDEFLAKVDHQLSESHLLTLDYFQTKGNSTQLPPDGNISGWSTQYFIWRQQNVNVSDVWTHGSTMSNQVWLNYSRMIAGRTNLPAKSLADFGSTFNVQGPPQLPQIAVSGWFTLSQSIAGPLAGDNFYGLRDVLLLNRGKHVLHAGGEASLEKDAQQTLLNDYGVFSFSSSGSARTGNALSDFVMGRPNTMNQDSPVYANANYWNLGLFFEDDWHFSPRLTLNLGLRYDVQTAPTDTARRQLNFETGVQSTVIPTAPKGLLVPGDPGVPDTGATTNYDHVSPRVGFSCDPYGTGHTVLHGGAGLFFGSIGGNEFELPSNTQPYDVRAQYTKVVSMANPYATDTSDFPGGVSPYPYNYTPSSPRFIKPTQVIAFDPNYRWPAEYQINFGIEQQFSSAFAVTMNYVASLSRKLPIYWDVNYAVFNIASPTSNTTSTANARRPINVALGATASPVYSQVYVIESNQTSNYNGFQVTFEKRLSQHFSLKGFYIFSKTLSSIAQDNNTLGNNFEDYNLSHLDRQRSDYDMRNQSITSLVVKPDYYSGGNHFVRGVLNGWTLTAIATFNSGTPFNITTGSDNNGDGDTNDRPNVVAGHQAQLASPRSAARWFDPTVFCSYALSNPSACPGVGPDGSDGTVRANLLDSPGVRNIDGTLFRDFPIHERSWLQLRFEALNVFNLRNLGSPNGTFTSGNFGKITGENGSFPNREIQLGARILF